MAALLTPRTKGLFGPLVQRLSPELFVRTVGARFAILHLLSVGNSGTQYGFSSGSFGAISPESWQDVAVVTLLHDTASANSVYLSFSGGAQPATAVTIRIGQAAVPLAWVGGSSRYEGTSAAIAAALIAANGAVLDIAIEVTP